MERMSFYREPVEGTPPIYDNVGDAPDYSFETVVVWARDYFGDATRDKEMYLEVYPSGTASGTRQGAASEASGDRPRPLLTRYFSEGYLTFRIPTELSPGLYDLRGVRVRDDSGTADGKADGKADYWIADVFFPYTAAFLYHADMHGDDLALKDGNFTGVFPLFKFDTGLRASLDAVAGSPGAAGTMAEDMQDSLRYSGAGDYLARGGTIRVVGAYVHVSGGFAVVSGLPVSFSPTAVPVPEERGTWYVCVSRVGVSLEEEPTGDVLTLGRVVRDGYASTLRLTSGVARHPVEVSRGDTRTLSVLDAVCKPGELRVSEPTEEAASGFVSGSGTVFGRSSYAASNNSYGGGAPGGDAPETVSLYSRGVGEIVRTGEVSVYQTGDYVVLTVSGGVVSALPRPKYRGGETLVILSVPRRGGLSLSVSGTNEVFSYSVDAPALYDERATVELLPATAHDGTPLPKTPRLSESRNVLRTLTSGTDFFSVRGSSAGGSGSTHAVAASVVPGVLWRGAIDPDDPETYSEATEDVRVLYEYPYLRVGEAGAALPETITLYSVGFTFGSNALVRDGIPEVGRAVFGLGYQDGAAIDARIAPFVYLRAEETAMGTSHNPLSNLVELTASAGATLASYASGGRDAELLGAAARLIRQAATSGEDVYASPFPRLDAPEKNTQRSAASDAVRAYRRLAILLTSPGGREEIERRLFAEDLPALGSGLAPGLTVPEEVGREGIYAEMEERVYPVFSAQAHPTRTDDTDGAYARTEDLYPGTVGSSERSPYAHLVSLSVHVGLSDENEVFGNLEGLYARFSGGYPLRAGARPLVVRVEPDAGATPEQLASSLRSLFSWCRSFDPVRGLTLSEAFGTLPEAHRTAVLAVLAGEVSVSGRYVRRG